MPGFYTEADYENSVIELFENMGYQHVYGPDIDPSWLPYWNLSYNSIILSPTTYLAAADSV